MPKINPDSSAAAVILRMAEVRLHRQWSTWRASFLPEDPAPFCSFWSPADHVDSLLDEHAETDPVVLSVPLTANPDTHLLLAALPALGSMEDFQLRVGLIVNDCLSVVCVDGPMGLQFFCDWVKLRMNALAAFVSPDVGGDPRERELALEAFFPEAFCVERPELWFVAEDPDFRVSLYSGITMDSQAIQGSGFWRMQAGLVRGLGVDGGEVMVAVPTDRAFARGQDVRIFRGGNVGQDVKRATAFALGILAPPNTA